MRELLAVALLAYSATAGAQECSVADIRLQGAPSLSSLLAAAKSANLKKDEFETTAAYEQRVAAASSGMPKAAVPLVVPQELGSIYDADSQLVTFSPYSLPLLCSLADYGLSKESKAVGFGKKATTSYGMEMGRTYCVGHVVSQTEGKAYEASNAYGAKVTVTPVVENAEGLYLGYGETGQSLIAGRDAYATTSPFTFSATPAEAKSLKANAAFVFLAQPVPPFVVQGTRRIEPKVTSPIDVTTNTSYLAVAAKCIGIVDRATGKVFAVQNVPAGKSQ